MFYKQQHISNNWYFEICKSIPFSWIALLMKKIKNKSIFIQFNLFFFTQGLQYILRLLSRSIKTDMKTEFYDCKTTSQKYLGSLHLMDFVSQVFSKNRVLQQKKMLFDYIHKYIHDTIEVINEEQNDNLKRLVLLPRQSKPVHTTIQFPDACSSPWTTATTSTWV